MDTGSFTESVTPSASETRHVERRRQRPLPMLLTIDETADLLRTTRRAVYAMVERRQLPGVVRVRRRVLVRSQELLNWLDQKSALSLKEYKR
jgi:excisionase family DNA binding protein